MRSSQNTTFVSIKNTGFYIVTLLAYFLLSLSAQAAKTDLQKSPNHYISHQWQDNTLTLNTTLGQVNVRLLTNEAMEVHYQLALFKNRADAKLPSYAIKEQLNKANSLLNNTVSADLRQTENQLVLATDKLQLKVNKSPFRLSFFKNNQLLLAEESGYFSKTYTDENQQENAVFGFRFYLQENEKLLGGGERVLGMDRRGHKMPLYNRAHYGYTTESNQMNFSLPAVMSTNKYILLFDNSAKGSMDLGKTETNIMQFEAVGGRAAYLVFAGDSYPKLINNYVDVTGKQPLPPKWALGNFASRFGYKNEQQVRDTVAKFKALDFPLDALVLDLYWFGKDIKGHMGNLQWDKSAFPAPEQMISDLKAQGVKTVIITEPFVLTQSKKYQEAVQHNALAKDKSGEVKKFDFYFGNTALIDIFNQQGRDWFNTIYNKLTQQGISGWWGDLGEPEVHPSDMYHTLDNGAKVGADFIHNVYGHQWAKMVYQNQLLLNKSQRPFNLMRSGFAGSQRYGMIPWTGDVSRSWGGLKPQVELSLQMSLLGLAYTHSDLGGFAGGEVFDQQLYIRWLQYGIFQPIYRPHGQDNIAPEVVFHDKTTQSILRKFIKLRYQLLPYNYTLAYQNSTTGMPLMRPLFFEDENNLKLINNANSYLWGDAFLVTPVTKIDVNSVEVVLPSGIWFDYFTGKKYQGGQTIVQPTTLETLPVLVRAGAFIPMIEPISSTDDYQNNNLTLHYYADETVNSATGEMFNDDGKSNNTIKNGQYELLSFTAKQNDQHLQITLQRQAQNKGYDTMPKTRQMSLIVHHYQHKPQQVIINEKAFIVSKNSANNVYWQEESKTLNVKFTWQHQPLTLLIQ